MHYPPSKARYREKHRTELRRKGKVRYDRLVAGGRCPKCGQPTDGYITCESCRAINSKCDKKRSALWHAQKSRRHHYDILEPEYERLLAEQNFGCALCNQPFTVSPCVDHSHFCENQVNHRCKNIRGGCAECVRGLLCGSCNVIVVRFLEMYPDRMTETERTYFADRPIKRYRFGAETTLTET